MPDGQCTTRLDSLEYPPSIPLAMSCHVYSKHRLALNRMKRHSKQKQGKLRDPASVLQGLRRRTRSPRRPIAPPLSLLPVGPAPR
ncbi:hypothetical protein Q5P01_016481 [Channa striata]|uniref:Uncharacterized protein n=1 Tax=Channa striata TaxID=64152 RepID=A0AA88MH20_CHASR|nr:hypothetical protein Q5P01_016481 [Channa striata]